MKTVPEIASDISALAKARMETEAHQDINAAKHAIWMEVGLNLTKKMGE